MICLFASVLLYAQSPVRYIIEGPNISALIDLTLTYNLDSVLASFGFEDEELSSLAKTTSTKGWYCSSVDESQIKLVLDKNKKVKDLPPSFSMGDAEVYSSTYFDQPPYGINTFKKENVFTENGKTAFFLEGNLNANSVYLSGSFNEWSTLSMPMSKVSNGWKIELQLPAGKHLYKYIIDGGWTEDKQNKQKENDLNGGYNSVYFVYNHTFKLKGFPDASKVILTSSFNNWNENQLKLKKVKTGWSISLYVRPGTHAYKYIVDGDWTLDPKNNVVREDGTGNENNFMSVGDTLYFRLRGFHEAKTVYCAGNFNAWNWSELKMHKSSRGWIIPYVLAPGNYEYKFKVDEDFITDPYNILSVGKGRYRNSLLIVEPNVTFTLKGYPDAKKVQLSGDFNGWDTEGYQMFKKGDSWQISVHLKPGKHLYKFIVDGEWTKDPENTLWEKNQYDSQNSIIWIKPLN